MSAALALAGWHGRWHGLQIDRRILGSAACAAMAPLAIVAAGWLSSARVAWAAASPWLGNPQSQVRLVSGDSVAPRHGELRLGVQFRLAPGWHAYWKNSGDAGFAPIIAWKRVPGLGPPELLWPAPSRFELPGGLEAFGYSGEVVYPARATLDAAPGTGLLRLGADVDYLVCEVDCVPYRYTLILDQPLGERAEADPRTTPLLDRWWRQVPLALAAGGQPAAAAALPATPGNPEITARAQITRTGLSELRLVLRLRGVSAAPGGADLFFESHPAFELGRPRLVAMPGELRFAVPARRKDTSAPLPAATDIAWTATGLAPGASPAPLALSARQRVPIAGAPAPDPPAAAAGATRRPSLRGMATALDPRVVAAAAVAAALLTLEGWGLLRRRRPAKARKVTAPPRREAAGFLALLMTVCLLYALSLEISAERLAGVELALLAMGLLAWLRRRIERPGLARALLAAGLAACMIVPPWLAGRDRLAAGQAGQLSTTHRQEVFRCANVGPAPQRFSPPGSWPPPPPPLPPARWAPARRAFSSRA